MAEKERTDGDAEWFRSLGFDLHYENMRMIGDRDVIVASIGGAGQALLGNILLELELNYLNLATERLHADGSSVPMTDPHSATRRNRLAATYDRDRVHRAGDHRADLRFMKTHLPAEEFSVGRFAGVWLLVRDPRDALYSWHQFHLHFAERDWEIVPDKFEEFLQHPFFTRFPPVRGWAEFYAGWSRLADRCRFHSVVRFEDLKTRPYETVRDLLRATDLEISEDEIRRAVERSTYDAMRTHEDAIATSDSAKPDARIMRKGKIDEWRSWMTPDLASHFDDERLRVVARQFGYELAN